MKKFLAVVLAVAMVLSLGAVAFAAESTASTKIGTNTKQGDISTKDEIYKYDEDKDDPFVEVTKKEVPYGETLYIPLYYKTGVDSSSKDTTAQVTSADAVSGLKLSTKWDENGEYVEGVEIVKKDGAYYIAIETTGSSMDDNDVEGTITIKGKDYKYGDTSDDKKTKLDAEIEVNVVITLAYAEENQHAVITTDPQIFTFDDDSEIADEEQEFSTEDADDVTFTVDTTHQTDIVLSFNSDAIDEVEDNYPAANLDFYVFNGATFKKTGELFIPADEGTYFYEIVDNKAVEVDAEYDDYDEGYYLKTKTLGVYVVSDVKLATATAAESTTTDAATTNPTTGAAL